MNLPTDLPIRPSPSVHRLHAASVALAGQFNPPTYQDTRISVYAYLVLFDGQALLIDTGVGGGNAYIDSRMQPARSPLDQALARHGLEAGDVGMLVNSHLHFDHCGNNRLFPNAEIFVQEQELATARRLGVRYTVPGWFDYDGARIHAVRGDVDVAPGISLVATPGHTPGHQSVLVQSADRRLLVAAQAAFTAEEYERGGDPREQAHEGLADRYVESIARLKSFAADEVYFSHDARTAADDHP